MPAHNYKEKLLHLIDIFHTETDEKHPISIQELVEKLEECGIKAERKSLYDDIGTLNEFGYSIQTTKKGRYYQARRVFLPSEIRLVADAVQSARFIPEEKTRMLLSKLYSLLPEKQAKSISSQVFLENRPKPKNDEIYENIESIQEAIEKEQKITFKYFDYTARKERELRKGGKEYNASPYALAWFEDAYYLVCNMDRFMNLAHYRVDRMCEVKIQKEKIRPIKEVSEFHNYLDIADYLKGTFSMFGGEPQTVRIRFREHLATAVFGRFGMDTEVLEIKNGYFVISVKVRISEGFLSWLLLFEDDAEVLSPKEVRDIFISRIKKTLSIYE
jgi:predicted DNA-binding transcriptional regulator YafY